jgi:hypothetical protein
MLIITAEKDNPILYAMKRNPTYWMLFSLLWLQAEENDADMTRGEPRPNGSTACFLTR